MECKLTAEEAAAGREQLAGTDPENHRQQTLV